MNYLRATGRSEELCQAYENYYRAQGLFGMPSKGEIDYSVDLDLDLGTVVPSVAGPKRPQDRIELPNLKREFISAFTRPITESGFGKTAADLEKAFPVGLPQSCTRVAAVRNRSPAVWQMRATPIRMTELEMANNRPTPDSVGALGKRRNGDMRHGSVLIAAITSCTNTSNPSVMLAAGLLAKKAVERGCRSIH